MILTQCSRTGLSGLDGRGHAIARIEGGYLRHGDLPTANRYNFLVADNLEFAHPTSNRDAEAPIRLVAVMDGHLP